MNLPVLYKKTSNGRIQQWKIWTEGNSIFTEYGQVGGKLQVTEDIIHQGKNIGKVNETTPVDQAELEARAQHERKLKKDYVLKISAAEKGERSELVTGGIDPMLAHSYDKHGHKMIWPAYVQRKYDGIRSIGIIPIKGPPTLWTRTRKPILSMPHIIEALSALRTDKELILDGELYEHQYRNDFEKIVSLVRPDEPRAGHEIVEYHIYDIDLPWQYEQRMNYLETLNLAKPLISVATIKCRNETAARETYAGFMVDGYEGAILRNPLTLYEHKRSYGLLKMKEMQDAEFKIVGVEEGRGRLMGCAGAMVCELPDGRTFNAKMDGSHERLREFFLSPPIGKLLTVKFQNYTTDGIPRFPVGQRLRTEGL
jgi:DNA ligase 1